MAIGGRLPPNFIVDAESDRSTSWPDGSMVFCKDTKKTYVLSGGVFYAVWPGLSSLPTINIKKKGSDQTIETTTWTTITNLGQAVAANEVWGFEIMLVMTPEATDGGFALGMTGPTSYTRITHKSSMPTGPFSEVAENNVSAYDGAAGPGSSAPPTNFIAEIKGSFNNGAVAGTLQPRLKCEVGTRYHVILSESWARYTKLP